MLLMNIEAERARCGQNKEEFSKKLGVSLKTYYNWVSEKTPIPSTFLLKMSKTFGVSMEYLLESYDKNMKAG